MALNDLLKPKYVLGVIVIILMAALMYTKTIDTGVGITVIIGVLAALGLYEGAKRSGKMRGSN